MGIEIGQSLVIGDLDGEFVVTAFDANHCPGKLAILFMRLFLGHFFILCRLVTLLMSLTFCTILLFELINLYLCSKSKSLSDTISSLASS